eukprot:Gb_33653 [translate_table: standard]
MACAPSIFHNLYPEHRDYHTLKVGASLRRGQCGFSLNSNGNFAGWKQRLTKRRTTQYLQIRAGLPVVSSIPVVGSIANFVINPAVLMAIYVFGGLNHGRSNSVLPVMYSKKSSTTYESLVSTQNHYPVCPAPCKYAVHHRCLNYETDKSQQSQSILLTVKESCFRVPSPVLARQCFTAGTDELGTVRNLYLGTG